MTEPRSCGACTACCTALAILDDAAALVRLPSAAAPESLAKPAFTPCRFLGAPGAGCSIYENRGAVCRDFVCLWLHPGGEEYLREEERPDRCGLVFGPARPGSRWEKETGVIIVVAYEAWPGAARAYHGEKVLKRLAKRWRICVKPAEGGPLYPVGRPEFIALFDSFAARLGRLR